MISSKENLADHLSEAAKASDEATMSGVFDPGGEASGCSFPKSDSLPVAFPVGERGQAPFPAKGS